MHRHGRPMWYDKNFNMVICKNGRMCCNVDHTWADASVMVHVFDYVFGVESSVDHYVDQKSENPSLPQPKLLNFVVAADFQKSLQEARTALQMLTYAVQMHLLKFQFYGKGLIKKLSMSPDAYCQMALQLAFYRLHKINSLTYETGGTVRFLCGRTETVRSCSIESASFCEAMDNPKATNQDRLDRLRAAVKSHVRYMRMATNGDGVDRHLFGLRTLAAGTGTAHEFLDDVSVNLKFRLSTSQTPASGMLGGGFSPLAQDGYAVSYVVADDRLWFHVSTYAQCPDVSASKFSETLQKVLLDMHDLCFQDPALREKMSKRVYLIQRVD